MAPGPPARAAECAADCGRWQAGSAMPGGAAFKGAACNLNCHWRRHRRGRRVTVVIDKITAAMICPYRLS